jgi:glutamyl-tRNA reductase
MIDDKIRRFQAKNSLVVIGANYRSSTMLLRDKLFICEPDLPLFYKRLKAIGFDQTIILSTTDLTEFILTTKRNSSKELSVEVIKLLSAYVSESRSKIENQVYHLIDQEAVKHVFAVAAGLDSLVIGDAKVKEQLNLAYQIANNNRATDYYLKRLIASAQISAEFIERETDISIRPISIAAAAVQVARDIHGELKHSSCLLIGAGEMGEMLASSMQAAGVKQLLVIHPSAARAETVGQTLNCHVGEMENLTQLLTQSDIVVTSINTRKFVLNEGFLKTALKARKRRPIFIIDTGVPGDVDPSIENLEDVFLFTLDDLERVTKKGRRSRAEEAETAWAIIDEKAKEFDFHNLKQSVVLPEKKISYYLTKLNKNFNQ